MDEEFSLCVWGYKVWFAVVIPSTASYSIEKTSITTEKQEIIMD